MKSKFSYDFVDWLVHDILKNIHTIESFSRYTTDYVYNNVIYTCIFKDLIISVEKHNFEYKSEYALYIKKNTLINRILSCISCHSNVSVDHTDIKKIFNEFDDIYYADNSMNMVKHIYTSYKD